MQFCFVDIFSIFMLITNIFARDTPTLLPPDHFQEGIEGKKFDILCFARDALAVVWLDPHGELININGSNVYTVHIETPSPTEKAAYLKFKNLNQSHAGYYTYETLYEKGAPHLIRFQFVVIKPPTFNGESPTVIYPELGKELNISCNFDSNPESHII